MKMTKKILSLLACVIFALALCTAAFAEESSTKPAPTATTLNIKTTNGHTYKVYQLAKGVVDKLNNGSGTLTNVEDGYSIKKGSADADNTVEKILAILSGKSKSELSDEAAKYIDTAKPFATVVGDGSTKSVAEQTVESGTAEKLVTGYYVVVDSYTEEGKTETSGDWLSRNLVAVVGETTMEPKIDKTDIDKNIIDGEGDPNKALDYVDNKGGKTDAAAIGDEIQFEVTGNVPDYREYDYYYYVLTDTLSKGLTLQDADEAGFTVKIGETTLTRGTDYYVYKDAAAKDDSVTFRLAIKNIMDKKEDGSYKYPVGTAISIKYNAKVNEGAVIGTDPNTNTAKLTYSNNPSQSSQKDKTDEPGVPTEEVPTGVTGEKITKTYVTELYLYKVDQDGLSLAGAEFQLKGDNLNTVIVETKDVFEEAADGTYYKLKNGSYTTQAPIATDETDAQGNVTKKANADLYDNTETMYKKTVKTTTITKDAAGTNVKATVSDDGTLVFTGLNAGTYTLTETKTPDGYNTVDPITFTISAAQTGSTSEKGGDITWSETTNKLTALTKKVGEKENVTYAFKIEVENKKGDLLPSTGGIGTTIFYVVGTILVLGAGVLLITKKRMER